MPETATRPTIRVVVNTEHQPRERRVPCSRCAGKTDNVHAICNPCIDAGAPVRCEGICTEVIRSLRARRAVPA